MAKMKTLHLSPVRHEPPVCQSYDDLDEVRRYERAVRVHRAHVEPYTLTARDDHPDGSWSVAGPSARSYIVDIVDRTGANDTCTCPDFFSNELGTCKHLEAARRLLTSQGAGRRAGYRLPPFPRNPTATVHVDRTLQVDILGSSSQRVLARLGLIRDMSTGCIEALDPAALRPGIHPDGIRMVHAVPQALARISESRQKARRAEAFKAAYDEGRIGVDVLQHALFPFQHQGVALLAGTGRALLADDMGLGKTVQAIAACEVLRARGEANRIVVVSPASLKHQWVREIQRYAGVPAALVGGGVRARAEALHSDAPYKVLSYELTWRELPRLRELEADILVLDEAQRARNFRTKTADTLRSIPSRYLFVLTGTPVENRLDDLYALLQLVDPSILGPLWRFNHEHHVQGSRGKVLGCKNLGKLRQRISPVVLRRRKEEVLSQLPALTKQTRYTALTKDQAQVEAAERSSAARYMALAEKRPLTLVEQQRLMAALLKARQACNALELHDRQSPIKASPKLDEFEAVVTEIAQQGNSKVLVFSEWVEMLKLASQRLDRLGIGWAMLHGAVPTERRPALLDHFRQDPNQKVLLSTDAGGVGLNLQVANYVVHLDLPWNPARLDQRTSRAHRLGQTRGVSVINLCSEGGIERGIEATLAGKRAVRSAALDPDSTVETIENQSFSLFLRQMRTVLEAIEDSDTQAETVATASSELPVMPDELPGEPVLPLQVELVAGVEGPTAAVEPAPERAGAGGEPERVTPDTIATPLPERFGEDEGPPGERRGTGEERPEERVYAEFSRAEASNATTRPPKEEVAPRIKEGSETALAAAVEGTSAVPAPSARVGQARSRDRLRLARVVLDAGFPGDAVRASYEALSAAIAGLMDGHKPHGHVDLLVAVYRDLLPAGRIPASFPTTLARLHDLKLLADAGIDPDTQLATQALEEASACIERLAPAP